MSQNNSLTYSKSPLSPENSLKLLTNQTNSNFFWQQPTSIYFWQKIFIYFYIFSFLGHLVELVGIWLQATLCGLNYFQPQMFFQIIPLALPYGLGICVVIVFLIPLIKKYHFQWWQTFLSSSFLVSLTEYLAGLSLIIISGQNNFWDYSGMPFNLHGQIALQNCLIFGLGATIFIYFIYPFFEKQFIKLSHRQFQFVFWFLIILFLIDGTFSFFKVNF